MEISDQRILHLFLKADQDPVRFGRLIIRKTEQTQTDLRWVASRLKSIALELQRLADQKD